MAKLERILQGDFDTILKKIEKGIVDGSVSASLEDGSNFASDGARVAVRVFERYSMAGSNRVSMTVTLFMPNYDVDKIYLSAITAGGSQAMFFKLNTIGEEAFLDKLKAIL